MLKVVKVIKAILSLYNLEIKYQNFDLCVFDVTFHSKK